MTNPKSILTKVRVIVVLTFILVWSILGSFPTLADDWVKAKPPGERTWVDDSHWETRGHWQKYTWVEWWEGWVRDIEWYDEVVWDWYWDQYWVDTSHWEYYSGWQWVSSGYWNYSIGGLIWTSGAIDYGEDPGYTQPDYDVWTSPYQGFDGTSYVINYYAWHWVQRTLYAPFRIVHYWGGADGYAVAWYWADTSHYEFYDGWYWVSSGYWQPFQHWYQKVVQKWRVIEKWVRWLVPHSTYRWVTEDVWVPGGYWSEPLHGSVTISKSPQYVFTKWHYLTNDGRKHSPQDESAHSDIIISWQTNKPVSSMRVYADVQRHKSKGIDKVEIVNTEINPRATSGTVTVRGMYSYAGRGTHYIVLSAREDPPPPGPPSSRRRRGGPTGPTVSSATVYFDIPINGFTGINISSSKVSLPADPFLKSVQDTGTISF